MKKDKLYIFIKNGNFNDNSIKDYINDNNTTKRKLLKSTFIFLTNYLNNIKNNHYSEYIIINSLNLISILCLNIKFDKEEIKIYKLKIIKLKIEIISFLNKHKNKTILKTIDILDNIIIDKDINIEKLSHLIKKLIDNKEYDIIINKFIKLNKDVLNYNNCELFDYAFNYLLSSIISNSNDTYYYMSILKKLYSKRIDKNYYINILNNIYEEGNVIHKELYLLLNGILNSLKTDEILDKYNIIEQLPIQNIYILNNDQTTSVFTIDDNYTQINDDAISFKKDGNKYIVGIHITDVGKHIEPRSIVDMQARQNFKTLYLNNDYRIGIYNKNIENKLSLNEKETIPTITLYVIFDNRYEIVDYYLIENNSYVIKNFNTNESEMAINNMSSFGNEKELQELYLLTKSLSEKNTSKERYWEKKGNDLHFTKSKIIISELAILYNKLLAEIAKQNKLTFIYKYQNEEYISKLLDELNIVKNDLLDKLINNIYLNSQYSLVPLSHSGLNENVYTSTTNPLRNYIDTFNQYLIHNQYFCDKDLPYTDIDYQNLVNYFNQRKLEISLLNREYNKSFKLNKHI